MGFGLPIGNLCRFTLGLSFSASVDFRKGFLQIERAILVFSQ